MRVFLAGVMQGSLVENDVHSQDYRAYLTDLLEKNVPGVDVFDPWAQYPGSLAYDDDTVRTVLLTNIEEAARSDLVIAYLPTASMGTALEVWDAWRADVPIVAISPLEANWVVRTCVGERFDTLDDFATIVRTGQLKALMNRLTAPPT